MADDNKALLLTSTILYTIAALVVFGYFCCCFGYALMTCGETYDEDEEWLNFGFLPHTLVSLPLAMEIVAAVCSGLLYKH